MAESGALAHECDTWPLAPAAVPVAGFLRCFRLLRCISAIDTLAIPAMLTAQPKGRFFSTNHIILALRPTFKKCLKLVD